MKTIKTLLILCATLCFAASCQKEVDMTLMQKAVLENADIRQIEVNDAWQVTVIADSCTYVDLEYSAYLEPYLKTNMEGNKLEIGFTGNVYPVINSVFRATVHTTQLEKLNADDAVQMQCDGEFTGSIIEIVLNDASQCKGLVYTGQNCNIKMMETSLLIDFQFIGSYCKAELDDDSQFNGQIEAMDHLEIELEGASRFVNKGGVTTLASIKAHDASRLNMVETLVNEMHIDMTNGSEATIWVDGLLEGRMQDVSTLYYKGHPQIDVDCSDDSQLIPF